MHFMNIFSDIIYFPLLIVIKALIVIFMLDKKVKSWGLLLSRKKQFKVRSHGEIFSFHLPLTRIVPYNHYSRKQSLKVHWKPYCIQLSIDFQMRIVTSRLLYLYNNHKLYKKIDCSIISCEHLNNLLQSN